MNKHRQGYIDNCPLRNDFLEILKPAIQIDFSEQTAREEEKWSIYTKVDKYLSSSLFGEEDTIDIKNIMVYMIKFGIIKNKALGIIINNSIEVEKDLENTVLNSISVSNMFNAVKDKISKSEYDILFKNVKYYTIKYS